MTPSRIVLALAILSASTAYSAAADHDRGTISGTITSEAGAPIENVCVWAEPLDGWGSTTVLTDAAGGYSVELDAGSYLLLFSDCSQNGLYISEWYDDASSRWDAQSIYVGPHDTVAANAALTLGGAIAGTVTDTEGRAIDWICVTATDQNWESLQAYTSFGEYRTSALPAGSYVVRFGTCDTEYYPASEGGVDVASSPAPGSPDDYVGEYYDDAASYDDAARVTVVPGAVTGDIDAALAFGGSIGGTVTDAAGEPLGGICVTPVTPVNEWESYSTTYTDQGGAFRVRGLRAGSYKIRYDDCDDYRHRSEWFDDTRSFLNATVIDVTLGAHVGDIDAALERRPVPDVAVTSLTVEPVPVRADAVAVPAGTLRDVTIDVASLGTADPGSVALYLFVEMADGKRRTLAERLWYDVEIGDSWRETVRWDAKDAIGDARVFAEVCTDDDANQRNDWASAHTYALIGGTGAGTSLRSSDWSYCYTYDPW